MYRRIIVHRLTLTKSHHHLRFFTQSSAAAVITEDPPPLTYLDEFPKPGPAETIHAIPRATSGKNIAVKERKAGRVPSIVFEQEDGQHGGNKRLISVQANQIKNMVNRFGRSFFLSRLFNLQVGPEFGSGEIIEKVRVLPRLVHLHAVSEMPINVTFIRAPSDALLKVDVPLVYKGEDVSPGLKKDVMGICEIAFRYTWRVIRLRLPRAIGFIGEWDVYFQAAILLI